MNRSILAAIIAAVMFLFAATSALAATAVELGACKVASDPIDCFLSAKQACVGDDQDCIDTVELVWAQWRAEAAEAKLAVAAKPVQAEVRAPAPEPPAVRPMAPVFPVGGVPAPEMMDPPVKAYSYQSQLLFDSCDECAKIWLDPNKVYVVRSAEGGYVPIVDRFGRVRTIIGNMNGDTRIDAVEVSGTPATWAGQSSLWIVGLPNINVSVDIQEIRESRPGYWVTIGQLRTFEISGRIHGSQGNLSVR